MKRCRVGNEHWLIGWEGKSARPVFRLLFQALGQSIHQMPKVTRGTLAVACVLFGAGLGFFLGRWSASEERLPIMARCTKLPLVCS